MNNSIDISAKRLFVKKKCEIRFCCTFFIWLSILISCGNNNQNQTIHQSKENRETVSQSTPSDTAQTTLLTKENSPVNSDNSDSADQQIVFVCNKMPTPMKRGENKVVSNAKGRIDFDVYYHKMACSKYEFDFEKINDTLFIYNVENPQTCVKSQMNYHTRGYIENLLSGSYTFILVITGINAKYDIVFYTTSVTVK